MSSPGPYALSSGPNVPKLGSGRRVEDFYPNANYPNSGVMTHFLHQWDAFDYARAQIGFGNETVTFTCHWPHLGAGLFTANVSSWIQEEI